VFNLIFVVLLCALVYVHPLLDLNIGALEVEVLALLFQGIVWDHPLHKGVNKVVDATVPFAKKKIPLEDVMPPRLC
jgi:hypothetical protein